MEQKKRDIFISYSRKDLELVRLIKQEIEQAIGCDCWMDLNGIESGAIQFTDDIVKGINNCRVFLFMLSDYSQTSEFALRELHFAYKKAKEDNKRVVIINISNCKMTDNFSFMYGLTDTIDWNNPPQHDKLIRDLQQWLSGAYNNQHSESIGEASTMKLIKYEGENKKYGFKDESGKIIIPCIWSFADDFKEDLARVKNSNEKWGYIDKSGKVTIPCQWVGASDFSNGQARVCLDTNQLRSEWKYIDSKGNYINNGEQVSKTIATHLSEGELREFNEALKKILDEQKNGIHISGKKSLGK